MGNILDYLYFGFLDKVYKKQVNTDLTDLPKICLYCGSVLNKYFVREHRNKKDFFWCSFICYKLYLADLNRKEIKETFTYGSDVRSRNSQYQKTRSNSCN